LRLLLDTRAAIWWAVGDAKRFPREARRRVTDTENELLLSAVVIWEVAIKRSLGKLDAPDDLAAQMLEGGAQVLPVTLEHAAAVASLPWHHRDPFDRLLVAQAEIEQAALVSGDVSLGAYDVSVVW
jgi:PIN domain nuclease of toxin-antitoxin system